MDLGLSLTDRTETPSADARSITLWHNIRHADGSWSGWGTIAGGNGTPFVAQSPAAGIWLVTTTV